MQPLHRWPVLRFCLSTHFLFAYGHQRFRDSLTPHTVSRILRVPPAPTRLSVTSTLLAMVDPHLPLAATGPAGAPSNGRHSPGPLSHPNPTPLAAVAGDARASVARAASAAAAKVAELKEKMNNTFSGMSLFSKGLLARKRANSGAGALPPLPPPADAAGAAAATAAAANPAGEEVHGAGGGVTVQRQPSGSQSSVTGRDSGAMVGSASSSQAGEGVQQQGNQQNQQQQQGAVHPGQAFRQHLDLVVQKTYGQVRDSLKRSVSAVLQDCMQAQGQLQGGPGSPLSPRVEAHGGEGREGAGEEGRSAEEEAGEDWGRGTAKEGSLCLDAAASTSVRHNGAIS